ncbi:hypothetical protein Q3G72_026885 [Acer saccharum]|nr:hypothetical protein Q3G72_026885 [Acer saccharum]
MRWRTWVLIRCLVTAWDSLSTWSELDDPVFNPTISTSASYTIVPCGSPAYDALLLNDRRCHASKCGYKVNYADGSYTKGTLMLETLTFRQMRIQNMAMGCGHNN